MREIVANFKHNKSISLYLFLWYIFNQFGDGNTKGLGDFIQCLKGGIMLGIVPNRLNGFQVDIGGSLEFCVER